MGARVYLSSIGRFLQVDPQQGGTPNNYTYPPDAVNDFDLSGEFSHWRGLSQIGIAAVGVIGTAAACAATVGVGCVVAAAVIGAAGGAGSNAAGQVNNGKKFDKKSLAIDTAIGGGLGALGGRGVSSQNNILRASKGRVSFGPAPRYYNDGRLGSKLPIHVHVESRKLLVQSSKYARKFKCWGRRCR